MPVKQFRSEKYRVLNTYFSQTSATRQDITVDGWAAINNLSITLTPESQASRFMLMANINHNAMHVTSFTFFRGGVNLFSHGNNTNETGAHSTMYWGTENANEYILQTTMHWIDSPNTSSQITYDVRGTASWAGGARTLRINDRLSGGTASDMRSLSGFAILEIAN